MRFFETLAAVTALLRGRRHVSYRALKREFDLDDAYLEDLKFELIEVEKLARDQNGEILVWAGDASGFPERAPGVLIAAAAEPIPGPGGATTAGVERVELLDASAERRHLTVMFCDLVGSTELSTRLDPEDLREVIRAYQDACAAVIAQFDGYIARYMGDGLLVYFGYPQAHEKDAERAVRTGLGIVEAMYGLNAEVGAQRGVKLAVRVGIATGLVVVGDIVGEGSAEEKTVVGETPNLAARLQGIAEPNRVVVGAVTRQLIGESFDCEDLGEHALRGIAEPVHLWCVLGVRELDAEIGPSSRSPLVGRDEELGLLARRWEQSKESHGQVVMVSGEPGIGKSALVETLAAEIRRKGFGRATLRCSPYHMNSAFYPVVEHLKRVIGWEPGERAETKLDRLEQMLLGVALPLDDMVRPFAGLLSLSLPEERYPPLNLTPEQHKQQTLDALVTWQFQGVERGPLLEVWEDLHWADPSTLELLGLLVDQTPTARFMVVATFRPEFIPPWPPRSHMTPITLNRLERPQIEVLVSRLAHGKTVPPEVVHHIVSKTDGVPLYVEELTKAILESRILVEEAQRFTLSGPLSAVTIPASLQESLMARLDRLPSVREVAQLGAVLGREFAYEMLHAIASMEEEKLQNGLGQLVQAELLYQRGRPPRAKYIFKHALVQDAAYQSLLRRTRQHYHQQVGELLEARFPETVETEPELVAHHFTEAGMIERAVEHWLGAGRLATRQSAHPEAIAHLEKGLQLLSGLPDTPERSLRELAYQSALGPVVMATQGYASPEAMRIFIRAHELCRLVGETEDLYPVLWGVWLFNLVRAEHEKAKEVADELLSLSHRTEEVGPRSVAHFTVGVSLLHVGMLAPALEHLERTLELRDRQERLALTYFFERYAVDLGSVASAYRTWILWLLGHPDGALEHANQALALVEQMEHPFTRSRAFHLHSVLYQLRREWTVVRERAEAAVSLAREHGFALVLGAAQVMQGAALAAQGEGTDCPTQMRRGLEAYRATGAAMQRPHQLALLAEALGISGRPEEGLEALAEALAFVEKSGERYYEAEIHRLKGELLLAVSPSNEAAAERCFHHSLEIARRQSAKSLELRTAMSLTRLAQRQGKLDGARERLAAIHDSFTEGFDTPDLKDARALGDTLRNSAVESRCAGESHL